MTTTGTTTRLEFHDDPGPAIYARLLHTARETGRCPVWLGHRSLERIVHTRPPENAAARIARTDAHRVLSGWWPGGCAFRCGCRDPFDDGFPARLVRDGTPGRATSAATVEAAVTDAGRAGPWSAMAVVDAARPADIPAAVGWAGICNYYFQDLVGLSAVLRSWEDRFGAVLVRMDDSALYLAVADPPRTDDECEHVAAEHFAFCPDQPDPQNGTEWTLRRYASSIRGATRWRFWWD